MRITAELPPRQLRKAKKSNGKHIAGTIAGVLTGSAGAGLFVYGFAKDAGVGFWQSQGVAVFFGLIFIVVGTATVIKARFAK